MRMRMSRRMIKIKNPPGKTGGLKEHPAIAVCN